MAKKRIKDIRKLPDKNLQNSALTRQVNLEHFLKIREDKRTGFYHGEARS